MRGLLNEDMYLISEMIDKMSLTLPPKSKIVDGKTFEKTNEEYGLEIITKIVSKVHLASNPVNKLLANVMETTEAEVKKMKLTDTIKAIKELFGNAGFTDFFK
jgi:hydroxylamine reductase (hybrid-cluster protein)